MIRNFDEWLSGFRDSIANYGYYVDFDKVYKKVEEVKVELNILNSLIGSTHIEKDFKHLADEYPHIAYYKMYSFVAGGQRGGNILSR